MYENYHSINIKNSTATEIPIINKKSTMASWMLFIQINLIRFCLLSLVSVGVFIIQKIKMLYTNIYQKSCQTSIKQSTLLHFAYPD